MRWSFHFCIMVLGLFLLISCGLDDVEKPDDVKPVDQPKELISITLVSEPDKTNYYLGDTLSLEGIVVKGYYSDKSVEIINDYSTNIPDGYEFGWSDLGRQSLQISYMGKYLVAYLQVDYPVLNTKWVRYKIQDRSPVAYCGYTFISDTIVRYNINSTTHEYEYTINGSYVKINDEISMFIDSDKEARINGTVFSRYN